MINIFDAHLKVKNTIESCVTEDHISNVRNFVYNFADKYQDNLHLDKLYSDLLNSVSEKKRTLGFNVQNKKS